jgi:beta-glucosidase
MPWVDKVPAIIQDWYLGSEAGHSLADVLSGDVNPSGKLPFTIGASLDDYPVKSVEQYPGVPDEQRLLGTNMATILKEKYSEGIFVGYRWFDKEKIAPVFPFGYGLSYTTFEFGEPSMTGSAENGITFRILVRNTGSVAGAETVELYISDMESSVERPEKELKGFDKVFLEPGEAKEAEITIDKAALSFFDAGKHEWVAEKGEFKALFGNSSRNILKTISFTY